MTAAPVRLHVEYGPRPLGIGVSQPRLSWQSPSGQLGYQIEATIDGAVHTAAPAEDEAPFLRTWPFPALGSRSQVSWRVRVRSEAGWSAWSAAAEFETGLLEVSDWRVHRRQGPGTAAAAGDARRGVLPAAVHHPRRAPCAGAGVRDRTRDLRAAPGRQQAR